MVCKEKELEVSRRAHTRKKKALVFWNNFLAIELWNVGIYCKTYSLFSHNIFGAIMVQICLLHHMPFSHARLPVSFVFS